MRGGLSSTLKGLCRLRRIGAPFNTGPTALRLTDQISFRSQRICNGRVCVRTESGSDRIIKFRWNYLIPSLPLRVLTQTRQRWAEGRNRVAVDFPPRKSDLSTFNWRTEARATVNQKLTFIAN